LYHNVKKTKRLEYYDNLLLEKNEDNIEKGLIDIYVINYIISIYDWWNKRKIKRFFDIKRSGNNIIIEEKENEDINVKKNEIDLIIVKKKKEKKEEKEVIYIIISSVLWKVEIFINILLNYLSIIKYVYSSNDNELSSVLIEKKIKAIYSYTNFYNIFFKILNVKKGYLKKFKQWNLKKRSRLNIAGKKKYIIKKKI